MNTQSSFRVDIVRGGVVESSHRIVAVISDRKGNISHWGDPQRRTIARSAIKSIQALPLVASGAAAAFSLSPQEIALACASHSGESAHVDAVGGWLDRIGLTINDLECGPDRPIGDQPWMEMIRQGIGPAPIYNCCSGKHAGFLSLCQYHGWTATGYIANESQPQRLVNQAISDLTGLDISQYPYGIDGCGIPAYALPIWRLALAMARMVDPQDLASRWAEAAGPVVEAAQLAYWVSGEQRTEMTVAAAATEPIVVKAGAEGVFMAGLPARGLGVALKALDGTSRAAEAAVLALLNHLEVLDGSAGATPVPITNKAGNHSGEICAVLGSPESGSLAI